MSRLNLLDIIPEFNLITFRILVLLGKRYRSRATIILSKDLVNSCLYKYPYNRNLILISTSLRGSDLFSSIITLLYLSRSKIFRGSLVENTTRKIPRRGYYRGYYIRIPR